MSEQFPYNLERAQKEASKMQEKISSGEAKDYKEAEKLVDGIKHPEKKEGENLVEKELSLEQIEKIMEKVQDINKYGVAYRTQSFNDRVLTNGFLGVLDQQDIDRYKELKKKYPASSPTSAGRDQWIAAEKARKLGEKTGNFIFFNIIGRSKDIENDGFDYGSDNYFTPNYRLGTTTIIFDLSENKEVLGMANADEESTTYSPEGYPNEYGLKSKEYIPQLTHGITKEMMDKYKPHEEINDNDKKKLLVFKEYGFMMSGRVSPERFRGIIIGTGKTKEEVEKEGGVNLGKEFKELHIDRLAKTMKDKYSRNKRDFTLLPIYDVYGNLLWPKQMSYDEVKKFVEERDKQV